MKPVFDSFLQPRMERRSFLIGATFCSAAAIAAWRQPRLRLNYLGKHKLDDIVPKTIGRWSYVTSSGLVVPPEDELSKALYSNLVTRVYSDGHSPPIMLLLAENGSQTGFLQVHRPEICYAAGGYQISGVSPHPISFGEKLVPANRMDAAAAGGPTEHVVYWTRIGNRIPPSWRAQKLAVAEQNLEGVIPDAILVRVSTVNNDDASALASIDDFIRAMLASVDPRMRSVFVP
jgi:EpsI family protein